MARFIAQKEGNVIKLYGDLNGNTSLLPLDYLIDGNAVLDCSKLHHVAWDGLNNLYKKILNEAAGIKIVKMPHKMYKYWRMIHVNAGMPDAAQSCEIKEIEVPYFKGVDSWSGFAWADPETLPTAPTIFAKTDDQQNIFEAISFIKPSRFQEVLADSGQLTNQYCQENVCEIEFWYRYLIYFGNTISLCTNVSQDIQANLTSIIDKLATFEAGLQALGEAIGWTLPPQRNQILSGLVANECENYLKDLRKMEESIYTIQRRLQLTCQTPLSETYTAEMTKQELAKLWRYMVSLRKNMLAITAELEDTAVKVGTYVPDTQYLGIFQERLDSVQDSDLSAEQLENIRDLFCIMDPLSADSWSDTVLEIWPELEELKNNSELCTTNMQGFDLTRQIIEHRIAECDIIARHGPSLLDDPGAWLQVRDELYENVQRFLVTQQERYAAAFFFNDLQAKEREVDPGEMLFF